MGTPMGRPEFMRLPIKVIPQEIIDKCQLQNIVEDGWVYVRIERGMYGLPHTGKIAHNLLVTRMSGAGYHPANIRQASGDMCGGPSHSH